jgi:hypothetical protein
LGRQPGIAAEKNQLSARIGLSQVRFENRPVVGRQVPEYFGNAPVLARLCQFECTFNSGRHALDR